MAAVVFGFRSGRTVLHALDARVKLAALVFVSMAGLYAGLAALGLAFLAAFCLLALARCSPLRCILGMKWYLVLLGCVLVARILTTPGDLIFDLPWLPASRQGVHAGLLAAGRLLVIALFGLLVTFTTRPSEIRAAVEWLLRPIPFIPHRQAATMIGLLVRFIPVILSQSAEQQEALRARSIENCRNPLRRVTALAMPLLRRTCITADRLASAMEARCYGAERTIPCRPVTAREWSALVVVAGFCALMLGIS